MKVLCDSDFLISLIFRNQSTHELAKKKYTKIEDFEVSILNITKFELATVLSKKFTYQEMITALDKIELINVINIDTLYESMAWNEFFKHKKKNISYIDCANLVVAKQNEMKIASFDRFYPKELLV